MPADDYTDPAPATTFAHLDSTIRLERSIAELGIYPAVDPLTSTSRVLDPHVVGQEHYDVAQETQARAPALPRPPGHHRDPRHRRAVRGGQGDRRPRAPAPALHEPAVLRRPRCSPAAPGAYVSIKDTVASFKEILEGKADTLPEQAFFLAGTIDDVRENAAKLSALSDAPPRSRSSRPSGSRTGRRRLGRRARASRASSASCRTTPRCCRRSASASCASGRAARRSSSPSPAASSRSGPTRSS